MENVDLVQKEIDQRLNRIMAWAVLLETLERSGGDDVVIPIHTLGEIGRSISGDAGFIAERISARTHN